MESAPALIVPAVDLPRLYTDGACSGNPGPGGWAYYLQCPEYYVEASGSMNDTTNNRMEMSAVIQGLAAAEERKLGVIDLYTDSQYVHKGVTAWMAGWKRKHWKTAAGQPVKNRDLWEQINELKQKVIIHWHWVRGHAGDAGNERVDKLARAASLKC